MANIFNSVSAKVPKRHKFNLSHQVKLTGEMGELLPIMMEPVLPGDRFKLGSQQLIRFAPLVAPIMSEVDCYLHFFFVPNRLIWSKWEEFITASRKGKKLADEEVPVPPRIGWADQSQPTIKDINPLDGKPYFGNTSLADYLGFQTQKTFTREPTGVNMFDELPFRAYQRIYFDWYRDENLSSFDDFEIIDSDDYNNGDNKVKDNVNRSNLLFKLQRRAWKKDYFTSALPFAQKGDDVLIPGGSSFDNIKFAPIDIASTIETFPRVNKPHWDYVEFPMNQTLPLGVRNENGKQYLVAGEDTTDPVIIEGSGQFYVKTLADRLKIEGTSVGEGTIRELRRAMAAQKFLEREAVGGTRYIEQTLAFFGVKSSDARMQRTEFLGGSKQPVVISQVLQTSESTQNSPLAQPAGNAVSAGGKYIFDRTFEEHGWIVGLLSVIPRAEYLSGIPKKYLKRDRFDYYWPQFARIGEQPIQRQELQYEFQTGSEDTPDNPNTETFGYTPRYAEYRFINNHVHGDFKDTLDFWTLARQYGDNAPILNESFIECNPTKRIFAYEDSDFSHLWMQVGLSISALRPLPKYGESI